MNPVRGGILRLLSNDEISRVHGATMEVIEEGYGIYDEEALKLLDAAGAEVNYEQKIARIPEYLVKENIRKAPSRFVIYGADKRYRVKYGEKIVNFLCGTGAPNLIDLETGKKRTATCEDTENGVKLVDAMENFQICWPPVTPQDKPSETRLLWAVELALKNTVKPCISEIATGEIAKFVIEMASLVRGSREELMKMPLFMTISELSAPLQYHKPQIEILKEFARNKQPVKVGSMPIAGGTAPVTLAGTLVMANMDTLIGILLAQLINPGTPIVFWGGPCILDMYTGNIAEGSVEQALVSAALVQLGQYYGLPSAGMSCHTDSNKPGIQAGYEKLTTGLLPAMVGSNDIGCLGALGGETTSFEQIVIDNEIAAIISRVLRRIEFSDDTLAIDEIHEVGMGKTYLGRLHTGEFLRREHFIPKLSNRLSWHMWQKTGKRDVPEKANQIAKEIIRTHQPEPLDKESQKELEKTRREAERVLMG